MGYLGSKAVSGAYQAIIALMPPHDTYIELFAGSGAVLLRKPRAERSYAVDLDPAPLAGIAAAMPEAECRCTNAFEFLASFDYAAGGRVLIYADPPYMHALRTSRHRYRHEMTDSEHAKLLRALRRAPAQVILSGYPSRLYDEQLPLWHSREFQVMTRGGVRTEKLWFNFLPSAVHWASWAGRGFTDRQRIKRKAARWAANFRELPPAERLAVFAALLEAGHSQNRLSAPGPIDGGGQLGRGRRDLPESDAAMGSAPKCERE